LDVIDVSVGKKNVGIKKITFLQHDLLAKGANTGTRINYDAARTTSDLKASGITAILNGIRSWTRNASPSSPELETKSSFIRHKSLELLEVLSVFCMLAKAFLIQSSRLIGRRFSFCYN
jgi:hypothetical protein